jgi:2'-5' RNA ligase
VNETDIRGIALGMSLISQTSPQMCTVEDVKLYGNAIVLRVEPYQSLLAMHKKMNHKLQEVTNNQYQFQVKGRFDPHLTIGRIRNLTSLNALHKHQIVNLVTENFRGTPFLIQQAALLRRIPKDSTPDYQSIQMYSLRG